jgi:glutathione S-transferase
MTSLVAFKTFAACSTTLFSKFLVTTLGGKAFDAGMRPPEDSKYSLGMGKPKQDYGSMPLNDNETKAARLLDMRWRRIVQNDLESIPIGLAVFMGSILVGGNDVANSVLMISYTGLRLAHTISYAYQLQPHRSITWTLGQMSILGSGVNGIISMYYF